MNRSTMLLIVGLALLAFSTTAAAQAQPVLGPDWQTIATAVCGVLLAIGGAYLKGQGDRLGRAERDLDSMRELVLRDYQSKADTEKLIQSGNAVLRAQLDNLTREVSAVHARLDRMQSPHSTA